MNGGELAAEVSEVPRRIGDIFVWFILLLLDAAIAGVGAVDDG